MSILKYVRVIPVLIIFLLLVAFDAAAADKEETVFDLYQGIVLSGLRDILWLLNAVVPGLTTIVVMVSTAYTVKPKYCNPKKYDSLSRIFLYSFYLAAGTAATLGVIKFWSWLENQINYCYALFGAVMVVFEMVVFLVLTAVYLAVMYLVWNRRHPECPW